MLVSGRGRGRVPGSRDNAHPALGLGSGSTAGSSQAEARGANRLRANCKPRSGDGAGACAPELAAKRPPGRRDPGGVTASPVIGEVACRMRRNRIRSSSRRLPDPHGGAEVQHRSCAWDDDQSSAGARSAPTALLHRGKAAVPPPLSAFHATRHCAASSLGKLTHCSYRVNSTLSPDAPQAPAMDDVQQLVGGLLLVSPSRVKPGASDNPPPLARGRRHPWPQTVSERAAKQASERASAASEQVCGRR